MSTTLDLASIKPSLDRLRAIERELAASLIERDEVIRASLVALLTRQHLIVLGPPGCQPAGSKVLMADGSWKNVEDVRPGDKVISPQRNATSLAATVTETVVYKDRDICEIATCGRTLKRYRCADNHVVPYIALIRRRDSNQGTRRRRVTTRGWPGLWKRRRAQSALAPRCCATCSGAFTNARRDQQQKTRVKHPPDEITSISKC